MKNLYGDIDALHDEFLLEKLKKEIDALADRLCARLKTDNAMLIRKVAVLQAENERLSRELYGEYGNVRRYLARTRETRVNRGEKPKNY